MKKLLLCLICLCANLQAQEVSIDSNYVNTINSQTLQLRQQGKYTEAIKLNDNLLSSFKGDTSSYYFAKTLHARSRVEIDLGTYDAAITSAKRSKVIYDRLNLKSEVAAMENIIGVGFYFKSQLDSTLYYYNRSYDLKKQFEKDTIQLAISIFNIGIVHENLGKYDKAIKTYHEAESLLNSTTEKAVFMSDLYVALSNLYRKRNNLYKARSYAQLALKESVEKYGEDILGDDALFLIGTIYEDRLNEKEKAKEVYRNFLIQYPGSNKAAEARKRFRTLRGDFL